MVLAIIATASTAQAQCLSADLRPSDPGVDRFFGFDVDSDGRRIAVSAIGDSTVRPFGGAIYVFEQVGSEWKQTAKLLPPSGFTRQRMGTNVVINGRWIFATSQIAIELGFDLNAQIAIFEEVGGIWVSRGLLTVPESVEFGDNFGHRLMADGDVLVVSAHRSSRPAIPGAGSVFVFELVNGAWVETTTLHASNEARCRFFGLALALDNDRILVGGPSGTCSDPADSLGYAYVFERHPSGWTEVARFLDEEADPEDVFSRGLAIEGDRAAVLNIRQLPGTMMYRDEVYTFERDSAGQWNPAITFHAFLNPKERVALADLRFAAGSVTYQKLSEGVDGQPRWAIDFARPDSDEGVERFAVTAPAFYPASSQFDWDGRNLVVGEYAHPGDFRNGGRCLVYSIGEPTADCNGNGVFDGCDLFDGSSSDLNNNGVPDECELPRCEGDANSDGRVGIADVAVVILNWGRAVTAGFEGDLDADGVVGMKDLPPVIGNWAGACEDDFGGE